MFNLGGGELTLVALVAILLIPSKKLPQVATTLGRFFAQLQTGFQDVKKDIEKSIKSPPNDIT